MPFGTIKLKPGVETNNTPVLNEAAYSSSQLIRFLSERNGFGLAQKLGGWVAYFASAIGSKIRALKAWSDLNAINHLGVGAESSLSVLTNGNLIDITPRTITTNTAPVFVTTSGSTTVTITDSNTSALSTFDYAEFVTPVAVGGLVLTGPYAIQSVASTTFTITATSAATSSANTSANTVAGSFVVGNTYKIVSVGSTNFTSIGAASNTVGVIFNATGVGSGSGTAKLVGVYAFQTTSASSIVTCYFDNHGYTVDSNFYVGVPVTIGGITLSGVYTVVSVPSASSFTFGTSTLATSSAGPTAINSGNVNSTYYVGVAPQSVGTGFGVGGFGVGGFGLGVTSSSLPGTAITATDWTLDNFGQDLVACPAGGPIYYWQPTGTVQNAQILSTQSPLVNSGIFVAMPERQIIAYGSSFTLQSDPLLVRWCDIQDFTVWNAASTNQAGSFRIPTGSKIVAGFQGPQQGLLWTDIDVWSMQYVGYPLVYGFNKIGSNCGAISRHCIGQVNNSIYWMSQRNFFVMTGNGVQPMPCPIFDVVFQNINSNYYYKVCCGVNSQFNEVTWYYPSQNSTENDSYVKYNYLINQWDFGTLSRTAWIDQSGLGSPIGAGGDTYIYQHEIGNDAAVGTTTTAMLSSFQTGFFQLSEGENLVFVDQIWPDMKWGTYSGNQNATVYVTVYYTNYATDTATSPSTSYYAGSPSGTVSSITFPMTQSTEYISCRIRARFMAFSLNSQDVGTFWRLGGVKFRYQPDGKF
jgi:hypothetical protein